MNSLQLEVEKVLENLEGQEAISKQEKEEAIFPDDFEVGYACGTEAAYGDAISQIKEALETITSLPTEA